MYKLYHRLCLFFYRLYMRSLKHNPKLTGVPYERDPEAKCEFYEPFQNLRGRRWYFTDCETDGHYLCSKCIHNVSNNRLQSTEGKQEGGGQ